jgi:hypothetical protein
MYQANTHMNVFMGFIQPLNYLKLCVNCHVLVIRHGFRPLCHIIILLNEPMVFLFKPTNSSYDLTCTPISLLSEDVTHFWMHKTENKSKKL